MYPDLCSYHVLSIGHTAPAISTAINQRDICATGFANVSGGRKPDDSSLSAAVLPWFAKRCKRKMRSLIQMHFLFYSGCLFILK